MPQRNYAQILASALCLLAAATAARAADAPRPHNVIIFVADGLRHGAVDVVDPNGRPLMPTFADLRKNGVDFVNSHSLFPTVTTPNASAIATGHYLGDTGNFSNNLFMGPGRDRDPSLAVEDNINIAIFNDACEGNYLGEDSFIARARDAGFRTAIVGKHGPALVQDVTRNNHTVTADAVGTIVIDDATGSTSVSGPNHLGVPLPPAFSRRLANDPYFVAKYFEGKPPAADPKTPARYSASPARQANVQQQTYLMDVLTRAILPDFTDPAGDKKPFAVVYWSRDPDGTQHNELDGPDKLIPGVNGPTTHLAFQNADNNLKTLVEYLRATPDPADPGHKLSETTNIFITSDHGFSTASRGDIDANGTRADSFATRQRYSGLGAGLMPEGIIAIDLAHDLDLPLYNGDGGQAAGNGRIQYKKLKLEGTAGAGNWAEHPTGPSLIGGTGVYADKKYDASLIVIGGAIYLPDANPNRADPATVELVRKAVEHLSSKPYLSGVFVDTDRFGPIPGALSLHDINLKGSARTPVPAVIVNPRTFSTDPNNPYMTGVILSDGYRTGQGTHGSFGRQDTFNCMMAIGPDFKSQFSDTDPCSNADIVNTLAHITRIDMKKNVRGALQGRVLTEALRGGAAPRGSKAQVTASDPTPAGVKTYLQYQEYNDGNGKYLYFDAAGFPGQTVGLTVK